MSAVAHGPVDLLLSKLARVKPTGTGYTAQCPGHEDRENSLSINVGDDGKVLLKCHAGCETEHVLDAIGLQFRDLFSPTATPTPIRTKGVSAPFVEFVYREADGDRNKMVRKFPDKTFLQFRPGPNSNWLSGLTGVVPVPYRLPELLADPDALVFACEGEKDVDNVAALGLVATTTGGASSSPEPLVAYLTGRDVVVLPDNDEPGEKYADRVLQAVGPVAKSIQVVRLPDLGPHGDVSDYLAAGHTRDDLAALIADDPPPFVPGSRPLGESGVGNKPSSGRYRSFGLDELDDAALPELSYVIDRLIPVGALTVLAGREKEGKSLLALDLCFAVAGGDEWAGRATLAGTVLYLPAEDSARTVRDRLRLRSGGVMDRSRPLRVIPLSGVALADDHNPSGLDLNRPDQIADLRDQIREMHPVLLVLDCLRELHSAKENDSDEMSATMRPLRQLAHDEHVAIVVIHHAAKGPDGGIRGSTAIAAASDVIATWTTARDDVVADGPIRGTLALRGRDVHRTSLRLEMAPDLRFHPFDLPAGAGAPNARGRVLTLLGDGQARTAEEIATAISVPLKTIQNQMSGLLRERPVCIRETGGEGHRNDPRRFRLVTPFIPDDHTGRGSGTGNKPPFPVQEQSGIDWEESREESGDVPLDGFPGYDGPELDADRWTR